MPIGSELTNLTPTITVSERAGILPESEVEQNFTNPLNYTVTAEDGTQRIYHVTVGVFPVVSYSPYELNRLGAGDLYKEDLFTVSNIEPRNYNYKITLGSYDREGMAMVPGATFDISLVTSNSTNDGSDQIVNSTDSTSIADGDVSLSLSIEGTQYFNQIINKEQYSLKTANDVQGIQHDLGGDYIQANDIDMTTIANFRPIAYDRIPGGDHDGAKFSGSIDGSGYTINNLTIDRENEDYIALISYVNNGAIIKNIGMRNININGGYDVSGLVGYLQGGGNISNSYVSSSSVEGIALVGGVIGNIFSGQSSGSYWDIGVSGQASSAGSEKGINPTEGINTIRDDGDGTYSAMDGNNATVDVFDGWNFGNDDANPWIYLDDGQWPILYRQEEAQP